MVQTDLQILKMVGFWRQNKKRSGDSSEVKGEGPEVTAILPDCNSHGDLSLDFVVASRYKIIGYSMAASNSVYSIEAMYEFIYRWLMMLIE